jgi:hypothetical protein
MKYVLYLLTMCILLVACSQDDDGTYYKIERPMAAVVPKPEVAIIDATTEQTVKFPGGANVRIPSNAFVDRHGNAVKGPVTLSYTPYDTKAKILASGIPMKYTEAGKEYDFESAGMFNIEGFANGEAITIATGKQLEIEYPSRARGEYDFYYMEEKEKNGIIAAGIGITQSEKLVGKTAKWKKLTNIPVENYDQSKVIKQFSLKFDKADYPELKPLAAIKWDLATKFADPTEKENSWAMGTEWSGLELSQPEYIAGELLFQKNAKGQYIHPSISGNGKHVIINEHNEITVWSEDTVFSIRNDSNDYVEMNEYAGYFYIRKDGSGLLYNLNGRLEAKYPGAIDHSLFSEQNRVVYTCNEDDINDRVTIVIADLKGKTIKEIKTGSLQSDGYSSKDFSPLSLLTFEKKLCIVHADSICVYDWDGNTRYCLKGKFNYAYGITKDALMVRSLDNKYKLWSTTSNKLTDLPSNPMQTIPYCIIGSHYMVTSKDYDGSYSRLWDYETNAEYELNFAMQTFYNQDSESRFIGGTDSSGTFHVYDTHIRKHILRLPNADKSKLQMAPGYAQIIARGNRILIVSDQRSLLCSFDGTIIRDFTLYDPTTILAEFKDDHELYTLSRNRMLRCWDINGQLKSTKQLGTSGEAIGINDDQVILVAQRPIERVLAYDIDGKLLPDYYEHGPENNRSDLLASFANSEVLIHRRTKRAAGIYQLRLQRERTTFTTYIFADKATKKVLENYLAIRQQQIAAENKRLELESTTLRTFEIAKFGIYNWDRILDRENRLYVAATFEFPLAVKNNEIAVFLVTTLDGNAVIKYYRDNWKDFSIDTMAKNKLVAIMPGNELAVCTEEDLKAINWSDAAKRKTCTIKMKGTGIKIKSMKDLETAL